MDTHMRSKSARPYTSILLLLLVLLISGASPAFALPRDPLDPEPIDEPGGGDFEAPPGGFAWSVPSRFGLLNGQNMVDYRWDPASATYAQSYVNPAEFPMNFDGCPTQTEADAQEGSTTNMYRWEIPARGVNQAARNCRFAHTFAAQGTYEVKLTITPPEGTPTTHTQNVVVKDWLIVSIGDSYGSGEGNPDQPQQFDGFGFVSRGARWIDRRCHRSATAGPAQAARAIEQYDFKTSVTFLSFACSGATIDTPIFTDPNNSATFQGSGVLGSYRGVQPDDPNNYDQSTYLPAQIDALARTLADCAPTDASAECASRTNGRQIDALIISAGGNDLHFANIIADCVWHNMPRVFGTGGRCHEQPAVLDRLAQDLDSIDEKYDALANAIADPDPAGRPRLNARDVYVTEYPDPTQDDDGSVCGSMLGEILPTTPFDFAKIHIDADEARWAAQNVVGALNEQIRLAAERHANRGWHHVTGISSQFATHGYCADGHWIVQAYESARIQGPIWGTTTEWGPILFVELGEQKGTMHPNE